ncbi:MAG TPA: hypothetical protein VKX31_04940 [Brumimicrobium sp.]|nr:hypothetical protein [Brumimicrobium sp.]
MLRFIKQNLETIGGVEIYPIISLLIFVAFFVLVFIRVIKMSKSYVSEISDYPLEDGVKKEKTEQN